MGQTHHPDGSSEGRVEEVDAAIRGVLTATVVALATAGVLASVRYGWWYSLANAIPAVCLLLRRAVIDRRFGVERGVALLVAGAFVAGVSAASLAGGLAGHGVFFTCLVAMFGMMMFPARRWFAAVGGVMVAIVVAIDLLLGRSIDVDVMIAAVVLSVAVPAGVQRIVELETTHRSRSVIDPLTGCLNRRALENRAIELEEQSTRMPTTLSAIGLDIDHFKLVNDVHGHAFGDRVLSHVAYVTRKQLRNFELVYRTGGEEFVVLLPGVDHELAATIAERLRRSIEAEEVEGVSITASFGVASADAPFVVADVMEAADERVYEAKRRGRNRVEAELAVV